jgi:hypothetical protein
VSSSCAADGGNGISFPATAGAITPPFSVSGDSSVQQPATDFSVDANSGSAAYTFTVTSPGDYTLNAVVNAPSQSQNSFFVNVDGQPVAPQMIWDIPLTSGFQMRTVAWRGSGNAAGDPAADQFMPKIFTLTAGSHQLIVRGREGGTQVQSFTFVPMGGGGDAGADSGSDSGSDAGSDTGSDTGSDSGSDGGDNVVPAERRIDWSGAGVPGGIPHRTNICATLGAGSTSAQINSALATCSAQNGATGGVVQLQAGTYTLTSQITMPSYVTLRGAGPDQTTLKFTNWAWGLVSFMDPNAPHDAAVPPPYIANWTGGYAKGTTTLTLSNTSNLQNDQMLCLDQLYDGTTVLNGGTEGPMTYGSRENGNRPLLQCVIVKQINGNTVTVSPGLHVSDWNSALQPQAWWWNKSTMVQFAGVEDLKIDSTSCCSTYSNNFTFVSAYASWVKNVESIMGSQGGDSDHVKSYFAAKNIEIRDSFFHSVGAVSSAQYGTELSYASDSLTENNIFYSVPNALSVIHSSGNVYAYNYGTYFPYNPSDWLSETQMTHGGHPHMSLFEGNEIPNFNFDGIHGSAAYNTVFRERLSGWETGKDGGTFGVSIWTHNDYVSLVGNILGTPGYHTQYTAFVTSGGGGSIYNFLNTSIPTTLLRWGNYDSLTAKTHWDPAELPSGMPLLPTTLPASLYRAAKPSWWGATPWPAIGPDVSGGPGLAGHVYDIPAKQCFIKSNIANGGSFNAANCYGN